ncbi:hypothetical protein J3R83DRAFT_9109 [Lanmaoa asiatica]|nr:hypothetical protein J3R83DRAFT_9109 [Lanmaoa asiatica]
MTRGRNRANARRGGTQALRGVGRGRGDSNIAPQIPIGTHAIVPVAQELEDPRPQRPRRATRTRPADEGEGFDIHAHSDVSEDEAELPEDRPRPMTGARTHPLPANTLEPTLTDPLLRRRAKRADDVHYFFENTDEGRFYDHPQLYLEQAVTNNWKANAKFVTAALMSGYTLKTLLRTISQSEVDIYNLPPPPPKDPLDNSSTDPGPWNEALGATSLPEFSLPKLHEYIVKFLVAEDVAINKIESPYLRQLLLFCCPRYVKDSDIAHRTKFRELILDAWGSDFAVLKADLAVSRLFYYATT